MKTFFFILGLVFFFSCTGISPVAPSPAPVDDEIAKLKIRVNLLEKDSMYQAGQIATIRYDVSVLKRSDSIKNIAITALQKYDLSNSQIISGIRYDITVLKRSDSIKNVAIISLHNYDLTNSQTIARIKYDLLTLKRFDSISNVNINVLNQNMKSYKLDSVRQWVAIKVLQSASPVTAIPIMQKDIKDIQAKNITQDKVLLSHTGEINNLNDTLNAYKKGASADFGLDASGKVQISPAGMVRIKKTIEPQP